MGLDLVYGLGFVRVDDALLGVDGGFSGEARWGLVRFHSFCDFGSLRLALGMRRRIWGAQHSQTETDQKGHDLFKGGRKLKVG